VITNGCGNDALWKSQTAFHRAWESREEREIPRFPQAASPRFIDERTNRRPGWGIFNDHNWGILNDR
jgi:hypothetical protein